MDRRRLQELADIFAVAVGGFSVMDNHLHVLVRLDPDVAKGWSDEEVVRRWGACFRRAISPGSRCRFRRVGPMPAEGCPWVAMARSGCKA